MSNEGTSAVSIESVMPRDSASVAQLFPAPGDVVGQLLAQPRVDRGRLVLLQPLAPDLAGPRGRVAPAAPPRAPRGARARPLPARTPAPPASPRAAVLPPTPPLVDCLFP